MSTMKDGIIKRGSTYSYVVREKDPATGKTKPRWVGGFRTVKDAKEARDKARHQVHRGTWVAPQNLTVGEYLDRWIVAHEVELKPSTAKSYRDNIARYLKPAIGTERVQGLSPTRLSVVFKDLHETGGANGAGLSPRTVEFARSVLRRALQDAVLDRVIEVNPVIGTKRPRVTKPKHSTWTGTQVGTFLTATTNTRFAALWTLALATGMRRGELCALRWEDVDLDAGLIHVERSVTVQASERIYTTPKNHERRDVTLDPRTTAELKAWRKTQAAERLQWGAAYDTTEDLVFTWENGSPASPDYVSKAFVTAQAETKLPRLKLHEARHTHATLLLREGVPVHIVAKRLGHRDPSVTLNVYADAIPDDDGRAVDTFSRAVWGGQG
ncbi:tyrosine-type recombinase/integrase [Yimella sp. cx-573]|nr:tyrosine-type recombinase/integrase [Yimella sp. cx-573]